MKKSLYIFLPFFISVTIAPLAHSKNLDIYPGVGIYSISIGASKHKTRSIFGQPDSQTDDGDAYPRSGIFFNYVNDRIESIIITSPKYRTDGGISTNSTLKEFTINYPNYKKTCYQDGGASAEVVTTMYDAVEDGLAFSIEKFNGKSTETIVSLTVHRPGALSKVYGEVFKCR